MLSSLRTHQRSRRHARLTRTAAVMLLFAAAVALQLPIVPVSLPVYIRWADGLDEQQRTEAAGELGLARLQTRDDGGWIATLTDSSPAAVRNIVEDGRIADTYNIDRTTFRRASERITPAAWLRRTSPSARTFYDDYLEGVMRWSLAPLAALLVVALVAFRRAFADRGGWLMRGIPDLSPHALAVFRISYGLAMVRVVLHSQIASMPLDVQRLESWVARTTVIRDLSASATGPALLRIALVCSLALFAAGVIPRVALAISAALLMVLTSVLVTHQSTHDLALPMVAMWLMVLAPWHEGFGISWMWRRWRGRPDPAGGNPRGLAVWLPPFAVGAAFLAAAFAKLDASGLAWVTGGAIRYHFIADAGAAPVTWGLSIASSDAASVALSLGAVLVEGLFWTVILFRHPVARLAFAAAGAAILAGFYLFQGVWWPGWWILMLALLPWSPVIDALVARMPRFTVLADGECPMCRRTARILHALDWLDRLTFVDASDDQARMRVAPGLERTAALTEMYVLDEQGRRTAGYDGYLRLAAGVPLLWVPRLIGMLPAVAAAGRDAYRRVAASRIRRGRCTDDLCAPDAAPLPRMLADRPRTRLSAVTVVVVAAFVLQQIAVSALRIESEPLVSNFPMYSFTWPSREAFDSYLRDKTRRYELSTDGIAADELTRRLRGVPKGLEVIGDALDLAAGGRPWPAETRRQVDAVLREYRARYGEPLGPVHVRRTERPFDWTHGTFETSGRVTSTGTLDLERGTFTS
jgi:predicted DCC family thiol-disulfide oxidoreductase YuxK